MKCVYVILLAAIAFADATSTSCLRPCPKIYRPVCGFNGVQYKIFNNDCLMEEASCTDGTPFTKTTMNYCLMRSEKADATSTSCLRACPKIFKPVCGFNGDQYKIFNNDCLMEEASCTDGTPFTKTTMMYCLWRSEKADATSTSCLRACPKIFRPVCGFNGVQYKSFDNDCLMEEASCTDGTPFTKTTMKYCLWRSEKACNKVCPYIYAPVCATDGERFTVFSNKCMFEAAACEDSKPWSLTTMNHCAVRSVDKSCIKACPAIYKPVCGFDGVNFKLFANDCVMEATSCTDATTYTVVSLDKCNPKPVGRSNCLQFCPRNYDPICGFNGEKYQIFGNKCMFEGLNCEDSYTWQEMSLQTCEAHGLHAWN